MLKVEFVLKIDLAFLTIWFPVSKTCSGMRHFFLKFYSFLHTCCPLVTQRLLHFLGCWTLTSYFCPYVAE